MRCMKAGDLFMVQYCADHGSFRVLPLHTCEDLARLDMQAGVVHPWVIVDRSPSESGANEKMKDLKARRKECGKPGIGGEDELGR